MMREMPKEAAQSKEAETPLARRVLEMFGKDSLRSGQEKLIRMAMEGKSALGILPTGHGKSLCYQAAAALREGTSIVVSPLLALMREQVNHLQELGITARRFDSTLDAAAKTRLLEELATGTVKLLYVAPESLENEALGAALRGERVRLSLFIVDEAHCLSQWGHSFRPDYLKLPTWSLRRRFACTLAFTATATPHVRKDLQKAFRIPAAQVVSISPYRKNIRRLVRCTTDPLAELIGFLREKEEAAHLPAIIYTRTRKNAEELTAALSAAGWSALCYHAGISPETREKIQDDFLKNRCSILVATIAFGMGVDKPDVRSVVHVNLPSSPESYLQESGRAGRDGLPCTSLVLLSGEDRRTARNRLYAAKPDPEGILRCARLLLPAEQSVVSLWELGTQCDVPEDVPQRLLEQLRRIRAVRVLHQGWKYYKVRPLFSAENILNGRSKQERTRLQWLLDHREGEVAQAAEAWRCTFAQALEQLHECEASGEWTLQLRQRALCLAPGPRPADAREVSDTLHNAYAERLRIELEKLETLETMLTAPTCINDSLERYLTGAPMDAACGHCTVCLGAPATLPALPDAAEISIDESQLPAFDRPAQRRRFLIGYCSPALLSRRLYAHPLFGIASQADWTQLPASFSVVNSPSSPSSPPRP